MAKRTGPTPAAAKTERLLNLVIALLSTRQPLSKARIRQAVPDYSDNDEAFERMFERDKDELRALGIPLRTEPLDPFFDDEVGYRIDQREYALPQVSFEPDELAVIGLASRSWSRASLAGPAALAMRKLEAAGVVRDEASVAGIEPLLQTNEPAFEPMRDAVLERVGLRFGYRGGTGDLSRRHVQPWALTSWHGRWYLTGHDLDRDAPRVFRLDRVEGTPQRSGRPGGYEVPSDHDAVTLIRAASGGAAASTDGVPVRLEVREGAGATLRRRASSTAPGEEGREVLALRTDDLRELAEEVAAAGTDARVLEPVELAETVREILLAVIRAHEDVDHEDDSAHEEATR